ncbi:uncharacterized protein N7498_008465 [Penicillium cinerascens]|uniref:Uncharacterized protein n=1 Tax=Penicillium cinerascens TaxID=70096 RepID=A0A9W9JFH7_9EURO|nr:uncharacterized protein N7498_008465 [Penicillium cinerascens]KAJ5195027.1 hypothetical protein N7498_008465 [Penicillium cinerascens]
MLTARQNFKPCEGYGTDDREHKRLHFIGSKGWVATFVVADLILAEYNLRGSVQRAASLVQSCRALRERKRNKKEDARLLEYDKTLMKLRRIINIYELALYEQQATLPEDLRPTYEFLTRNPVWYLRKELIDDCIAKGGCCSRECRCCENRHLHRKSRKGTGHCTAECRCCEDHRGFEYTEKEKSNITDQLRRMLNHRGPGFVLRMAEAYFSAPDIPEPTSSKPTSESTSEPTAKEKLSEIPNKEEKEKEEREKDEKEKDENDKDEKSSTASDFEDVEPLIGESEGIKDFKWKGLFKKY